MQIDLIQIDKSLQSIGVIFVIAIALVIVILGIILDKLNEIIKKL